MTGSISRHGRLVARERGWRSVDALLTGLTRIPAGPETGGAPSAACDHSTGAIDVDLAALHGSIAALARSMRDELDTRRFFEGVSSRVGQRIAALIGPLVEAIALLHKERHRRRRLAVLPEVARVVGTSLNVGEIFAQVGDAVRPMLDFDVMVARLIGSSGVFEGRDFRVSDQPDEHLADRPEDYSFGSRLLAREPVLLRDARAELDPEFPGDRTLVERG